MINRQQGIVIGVGVLLGVACLVIGVLFFLALSTSWDAEKERDLAFQELESIYQAKVFPSEANIKRMKENQRALEAWAIEASNVLARASVKIDDLTPVRFKQELQKTARDLALAKSSSGKSFVAANFTFGFDRYLGDSDSLPQSGDVAQLGQQLQIISLVVRELYDANITTLTAVEREVFEADAGEKRSGSSGSSRPPSPAYSRRPGARTSSGTATAVRDTLNPGISALLTRQKLTLGFQARPAALIGVLNRLAAMDAFVVVSGVEFIKAEDSLSLGGQRKKDVAKATDARNPVSAVVETIRDRMVTDQSASLQ